MFCPPQKLFYSKYNKYMHLIILELYLKTSNKPTNKTLTLLKLILIFLVAVVLSGKNVTNVSCLIPSSFKEIVSEPFLVLLCVMVN